MPAKGADLDDIFAYETIKVVIIKDSRVGMIHRGIQGVIATFVIGFQLIYSEGYMQREVNTGFIAGMVPYMSGHVYSGFSEADGKVRAWDSADIVSPANEVGGLFITTKLAITAGQSPGECANERKPCSGDSDCKKKDPLYLGKCDSGKCTEMMWCPSEDTSGKGKATIIHQIEGISNMLCWFKAMIMFPTLSETRKFDSMDGKGPTQGMNAWTIEDLLSQTQNEPTTYDDVKADGAVISLIFKWACNVNYKTCKDHRIIVKRLDPKSDPIAKGFNYKQAFYYYKGEELVRDEYTRYGIRFLLSSEGEGRKPDVASTMMLVSSAIALLKIADAAADGLIIHVLKHKHLYAQCKFETTDDFSDLQDRIYLVTGEEI